MIQRLHHRDRATGRVELCANPLEARECVSDTLLLAVEHRLNEIGKLYIATRLRLPL
jgi:hypothetical protein